MEKKQLFESRNKSMETTLTNIKKEDRIIINGLTNSKIMPTEETARVAWAQEMVASLLTMMDPTGSGQILFHVQRGGWCYRKTKMLK